VAFGIVFVSKSLFEPLYRPGAIELIHEHSLNFGGYSRLLAGHAASDWSREFWSFFLSSVRTVLLTKLLLEKLPKLLEGGL
jgi:hypothetical protein